jgi:uncharacterized membrane protein
VTDPTVPPPEPRSLNSALERNIHALERRRREDFERAPLEGRFAEAITRFMGSMLFVYLSLALVGLWVAANLGWIPGLARFDPEFFILTMVATVAAIFLSIFVLIAQNRMASAADRRAELDLQISLLVEHEVTRVVALVSAIADKLGVDHGEDVEELKRDVAPEAVLDAIDSTEQKPRGDLDAGADG